MREDGIYVDRILLTTDAGYVPEGIGPVESPRMSASAGKFATPSAEPTVEVVDAFQVIGPYPNPASNESTLHIALPEQSAVTLILYDLLGREAGRLPNRTLPAGVNLVNLPLDKLPSGSYLYRLEVEGSSRSWIDTGGVFVAR